MLMKFDRAQSKVNSLGSITGMFAIYFIIIRNYTN